MDFSDKKVAIMGLSVEGTDSAKFFAHEGADVHCFDRRSKADFVESIKDLELLGVKFNFGPDYLSELETFDLIVRTPGMNLNLPQLVRAKARGQIITSLTKIFFELCQAPIIGVTGTKGKGTTSALIGEILKTNGDMVYVGGNIGTPLLSQVRKITRKDWIVLELSSFQLEDLTQSPHIAVVLNITQDHLKNFDPYSTNYHKTKVDYIQAKTSLVRYQTNDDFCVVNADYDVSKTFASLTQAQKYYFSSKFPTQGVYVKDNQLILEIRNTYFEICRSSEFQLRGKHNWENIAAASLSAYLAGASKDSIRQAVRAFRGLAHRLEYVGEKNGIKYYDDSFSTTPETSIAALKSFAEPIILIVGGSEKGSDYTELGKTISDSKIRCIILIGTTAEKIEKAVFHACERAKIRVPPIIRHPGNMEDIVKAARSVASPGDVVLLSPACASFDMFKNYKERGKLFKQYAKTN